MAVDPVARALFTQLGSDIEELNVTENGTYEEPGKLYNKVSVNVEGGGLPEVTEADNGDVLTVVNGAWDKASLPATAERFVITKTSGSTTDRTQAEVYDAAFAGKQLVLSMVGNDYFPSIVAKVENNFAQFSAYTITGLTDCLQVVSYAIYAAKGSTSKASVSTTVYKVPYYVAP